jgi:hypothetical protein
MITRHSAGRRPRAAWGNDSPNFLCGRAVARPRRAVDLDAVTELGAAGQSRREVAMALKVPRGTLQRVCSAAGSKP